MSGAAGNDIVMDTACPSVLTSLLWNHGGILLRYILYMFYSGARGGTVVEALRYKP
jgi:hypothetical protein